jgi:hypothetical protein
MPDAESLHARRGAHWTFNAHAFVAAMHRVGRFTLKLATSMGGPPPPCTFRWCSASPLMVGGLACWLPLTRRQVGCVAPQVRTRNEVLLPSFQHGVGDPVEDSIVVAPHHTLVLVEGNYLLIGANFAVPLHIALPQQHAPCCRLIVCTTGQPCLPWIKPWRASSAMLCPRCGSPLGLLAPRCTEHNIMGMQTSRRGTSSRISSTTPGTSTAMWTSRWGACTTARWPLSMQSSRFPALDAIPHGNELCAATC